MKTLDPAIPRRQRTIERTTLRVFVSATLASLIAVKLAALPDRLGNDWTWLGLAAEFAILVMLTLGEYRAGLILAIGFFGGACIFHTLHVLRWIETGGCGCLGAIPLTTDDKLELVVAGLVGLACVRLWSLERARGGVRMTHPQ